MYSRRVGRFFIRRELIEDSLGPVIYKDLVPWRVEHDYATDGFQVTAWGECFDEVPPRQEPPFYDLEIDSDPLPPKPGDILPEFMRRGNFRARFTRRP